MHFAYHLIALVDSDKALRMCTQGYAALEDIKHLSGGAIVVPYVGG
jgi:hypothetical protein